MEIKTDEHGLIQYLTLQGRLETSTAQSLETATDQLLHQGHRLFLIDAAYLEYISSSGIGSLVRFARSVDRAGGHSAVVGASSEVRWLLEFFGIDRLLPLYAGYADAERALLEDQKNASLSILTSKPPARAMASPRAVMPERVELDSAPAAQAGQTSQPPQGQLAGNLSALEQSLARVIESLEKIPEAIFELRENQPLARGSSHFHSPIVVDCRKCGSHLRIKKAGDHLCPRCGARFRVNPAGEPDFSTGSSAWQTQPASPSVSRL
jgi:anti-anti-sigma factor